ncbi:hypothetical protein T484DRAFT_1664367 [Baffinella frigidus]|nr:hypothetical protein T484DRAFT_1664367 [Cryptophyta sp. CCMP2293]
MRPLLFAALVGLSAGTALGPLPAASSGRLMRARPASEGAPMRLKGGCGFLSVYRSAMEPHLLRERIVFLSRVMRHRGPDGSGVFLTAPDADGRRSALGHERLAIVGVENDREMHAAAVGDPDGLPKERLHTLSGNQPLFSHDRSKALAINGEIYNHKALEELLTDKTAFRTKSDCESVIHLYDEIGDETASKLDGDFAFAIATNDGEFYAARDPIGVDSMYMGWGSDGSIWFASEMKCLIEDCKTIKPFPPGHYWSSKDMKLHQYYNPKWFDVAHATKPLDEALVRDTLVTAIEKRLMTDVPYGVLLSGGLDSSLVASCVVKMCKAKGVAPPVTFSIGLVGSPDLFNAQKVAKMLGTEHHEFHFTVQEGIDAVQDVIYHLETYDVTTIRAGTPLFLLARKIKEAPNGKELHEECVRKIKDLYFYDCLRANKATMAWGLEVRVPFLDKDFLDVVMELDPEIKMGAEKQHIEKWLLRKAFDCDGPDGEKYLPHEVLYRCFPVDFSDGQGRQKSTPGGRKCVGRQCDARLEQSRDRFPHNTPGSKEAYYSRMIFERFFPLPSCLEVFHTRRTDSLVNYWTCEQIHKLIIGLLPRKHAKSQQMITFPPAERAET